MNLEGESDPTRVPDEARLRSIIREEVTAAVQTLIAACAPADAHAAPELLTAREVAALLRVDARTLRRLVHEGAVPHPVQIGRRAIRWRARALGAALGLDLVNGRESASRAR